MIVHIKMVGGNITLKGVKWIAKYPTYLYFKAQPDSELKILYDKFTKNGIPHKQVIDMYIEDLSE